MRRHGLEDALNQARQIAKETLTYMRQMEQAPPLTAEGLTGDYRLLAEFNGTVLAGHPTQFEMQFITYQRPRDIRGFIHLTCCRQRATVITDFSRLDGLVGSTA